SRTSQTFRGRPGEGGFSPSTRLVQAENLQLLRRYLRTHPCVDCGERDPVVLEVANHTQLSQLVWRSTCAYLAAEIAGCDVRCANGHRRRTAIHRSWRKLALAIVG